MPDLFAARTQMAVSLGFHIVFTCIGMAMPWLMAAAEWRYMRSGDPLDRELAKAWAKGVAVFFAIGAVSGTVLSFELGLLWPGFMRHAGAIIGLPFSWEGTAFFIEAIALGLFLYGWERLSPTVHLLSGLVVGVSGVASGVLVIAANGWMNSPRGFRWEHGQAHDIDPVAAMFNAAWATEAVHMVIAAFVSTGFAVAGLHALRLLRGGRASGDRDVLRRFHQKGLRLALAMGAVAALLQPLSGDASAKDVARRQPAKLAAMEALYRTQRAAPLLVGGIPDDAAQRVRFGFEIPYALSFLAHGDIEAEVIGLDRVAREHWPPTVVCHLAFQIMVGCGSALSLLGLAFFVLRRYRPDWLERRAFLQATMFATPLGFVAVEAGWTVTEVGRQPWIIYGVMLTRDALTPMPGLIWPLTVMMSVYLSLSVVAYLVMQRLIRSTEVRLAAAEKRHG